MRSFRVSLDSKEEHGEVTGSGAQRRRGCGKRSTLARSILKIDVCEQSHSYKLFMRAALNHLLLSLMDEMADFVAEAQCLRVRGKIGMVIVEASSMQQCAVLRTRNKALHL